MQDLLLLEYGAEWGLQLAARMELRMSFTGRLAIRAAIKAGGCWENKQAFRAAVAAQLKKGRRRLIMDVGTPAQTWGLYGIEVTRDAKISAPVGCSGKTAKKLLTNCTQPGDDMLRPAALLLAVFGKKAPEYLELTQQNTHDGGQFVVGPGAKEAAAAFILSNKKAIRDKIKQGARDVVIEQCKTFLSHFELEWAKLTWAAAANRRAALQYVGVDRHVVPVATELKLSVQEAQDYTSWLKGNKPASAPCLPDVSVTGDEVDIKGDWRFEKLAHDDVRGPVLGLYTNCCQHPQGAGWACAKHGWSSPLGGFYVVKYNGRIVAQSWAWLSIENEGHGLCFDNIEVLGEAYTEGILALYKAAAAKMVTAGIVTVTVGTGYDDANVGVLPQAVPLTPVN